MVKTRSSYGLKSEFDSHTRYQEHLLLALFTVDLFLCEKKVKSLYYLSTISRRGCGEEARILIKVSRVV